MPSNGCATDVVVVGAGVMGAGVAAALTSGGASVTVVDRAGDPAAGATGASGGMVRAYDGDSEIAQLASESLEAYARSDQWPGRRAPLQRCGAVTVASPEAEDELRRSADALGAYGARVVTGGTALGVGLNGGTALIEPAAGWVDPVLVTRSWLAMATRRHAEVRLGRAVAAVDADSDGPVLRLRDEAPIRARAAVVATGGWSVHAPAGLRTASPPRTRALQVSVVEAHARGGRHATFVDLRTGAYARPVGQGRSIIGLPLELWDVDPDAPAPPSQTHAARTARAVAKNLPWVADARTVRLVYGVDAFSTRGFAALMPTALPRTWTLDGASGCGVRVAPAVTARVADTVLGAL